MPSVKNQALNSLRYRHHKGGDHSLCLRGGDCPYGRVDPESVRPPREPKNDDHGVPIIPDGDNDETSPPPSLQRGFSVNGQDYWTKMQKAYKITAEIEPLLVEACRMIDRLDKMDETLKGRGAWLYLRIKGNPEDQTYNVIINSVLRESREMATALRGLVAEIRSKLAAGADAPKAKPKVSAIEGLRDELSERRNQSTA